MAQVLDNLHYLTPDHTTAYAMAELLQKMTRLRVVQSDGPEGRHRHHIINISHFSGVLPNPTLESYSSKLPEIRSAVPLLCVVRASIQYHTSSLCSAYGISSESCMQMPLEHFLSLEVPSESSISERIQQSCTFSWRLFIYRTHT